MCTAGEGNARRGSAKKAGWKRKVTEGERRMGERSERWRKEVSRLLFRLPSAFSFSPRPALPSPVMHATSETGYKHIQSAVKVCGTWKSQLKYIAAPSDDAGQLFRPIACTSTFFSSQSYICSLTSIRQAPDIPKKARGAALSAAMPSICLSHRNGRQCLHATFCRVNHCPDKVLLQARL